MLIILNLFSFKVGVIIPFSIVKFSLIIKYFFIFSTFVRFLFIFSISFSNFSFSTWISLFIIINIGKAISSAVTYSGLGSVDKSFGLIFGIFKGYVICVCIFSLLNWFYPHKNWPIETEGTYSFEIIYKGSEFLVDEFPNSKDYYDQTEEKLEKI